MFSYLISPRPFAFFDKDEAGGADPSEDQTEEQPTGGDEKKDRTFTQNDVNKMQADARKQARSAVLKKAGVETEEALLKILEEHKTLTAEKLTEKEKTELDLQKERAEKERLSKEIADLRFDRDFDKALRVLDFEFQNEKAREVALKMLDAESAGKGEKEMQEAVKLLHDEHPYLFISGQDEDVDIDATTKRKANLKTSRKEVVETKRRSGNYTTI